MYGLIASCPGVRRGAFLITKPEKGREVRLVLRRGTTTTGSMPRR